MGDKVHILFLSELFYPHGSGGELATYLYAKLLSKSEFDVIVVTNKFAHEPVISKNEEFTIYRLPLLKVKSAKYSTLLRFDVLLSGFIRKMIKWADVVYIPRFWYSAIPLAKAYGKPVIVHLHGYLPICPLSICYNVSKDTICNNNFLCSTKCIYLFETTSNRTLTESLRSLVLNTTLVRFFASVLNLSDAIICVSKAQRNILLRRAPSLRGKTHVIYNPLPELPYTGIEGDGFGYFGGSNALKGFHILCRALAYARANETNVILRVHAANVENIKIDHNKWMERLGIIPYKRLDRIHIEKVYSQIRGVVIPSLLPETYSYVACEASLKGRVVIASDIGGIPEVLNGCPGAFLFRAGDYKQLADKMIAVKDLSREKVADLGLRNREVILKKFDNKQIIGEFTNLLLTL
jgi:glycosyltransferase involved in cell wall biosynthesis